MSTKKSDPVVERITEAARQAMKEGDSDGMHLAAAYLGDIRERTSDVMLEDVVRELAKMWAKADRAKRRKRYFAPGLVETAYVDGVIGGFCSVLGHPEGADAGLAMAAQLRVPPSPRFRIIKGGKKP